jgi:hypothetical protein
MRPLIKASLIICSLLAAIALSGCGENVYESGTTDSSIEACRYAVTDSLDNGDYEDVLASSCAHPMDIAAAYVGKASYRIEDVLNSMVEANSSASGNILSVYMNNLVIDVSNESLNNLYSAREAYNQVTLSDPLYDAARFNNIVIVNSLISISNIKGVMGGTALPPISTCDRNSNGTPDKADAAGCAFYIAAGQGNCTALGATYGAAVPNITFADRVATYTGYTITIDDNGGPTTASECFASEKKLLSGGLVAATSSNTCIDTNSVSWPCPYEHTGAPIDVVTFFEETLNSSDSLLDSFSGTGSSDASTAVNELMLAACGADSICTSLELGDYLQSIN